MSKKKLILSVVLLISLIIICIIIPLARRQSASGDDESAAKTPKAEDTEAETEPILLELDFQAFEELETILAKEQLTTLKEQLTKYLSLTNRKVTTVTFIPKELSYPNTYTLKLLFSLSDKSELPVYYDLKTDRFSFSEDETVVETKEDVKYEKATDYTLPTYTADEIEQMQEGGFPDTEASETKEVQP